MKTMHAVRISGPTRAEDIRIAEVPVPEVRPGWVLVRIRAFGLNHSEQILREQEITRDYIQKPVIPGIECVGEVENPSDSGLIKGQKICALMGGMGRSFDGSYAEYALLPNSHVFPVHSDLSWKEMAAVPETYYTAWGSLMQSLQLKAEDKLLIRGGTCALGYASIQLAKALGCQVAATTHRREKLELLKKAGADECILDHGDGSDGPLGNRVKGVTKALELVGANTLLDTLHTVEPGGMVCHTGILGGSFSIPNFYPIQQIPNFVYLTGFHSNFPKAEDMRTIFAFLDAHKLRPQLGAVYRFQDIREALLDLDHHKTNGKIVIMADSE